MGLDLIVVAAAEAEEVCILSGTEGKIECGAEISTGELERELLFGLNWRCREYFCEQQEKRTYSGDD